MDEYVKILISQANLAEIEKEVPIAAIIVKDGEIIAKSHNSRIREKTVISHAEVSAIIEAEKKLGDWRLNGCDLYVTLEPCEMCSHIIKEARIDNVYYILERYKEKHQFNKTNICSIKEKCDSNVVDDYQQKLSNFFKLNGKR